MNSLGAQVSLLDEWCHSGDCHTTAVAATLLSCVVIVNLFMAFIVMRNVDLLG